MFASLTTSTLTVRRVQTRGTLVGLLARFHLGLTLHRQRQHLASLDDALLADIGLTRSAAVAEAARPIWDVPSTWRR